MRVGSVLKILALGTVIGAGGLVVKNQQDEINGLRQDKDALVKRIDENEQAFTVQEDKQRKEFALVLEAGINTARKDLSGEIRAVKEAHNDLSGRVFVLGKNSEDISKKLDGRITKLETRPVVKTDEQIRTEMVQKVLPSVVDIVALTPHGARKVTGSIIEDRKGSLAILTCGHYVNSEEEYLKTNFHINFQNEDVFQINTARLPNGLVPWSSVNRRDVSIIRLTEEMQAHLRKNKIKPIPISNLIAGIKQGSELVAIGKEGKVIRGTLNRPHYYEWEGRKRSDIQTDAPIKRGDSGGPVLNLNGEIIGIASWGLKPDITITGPKELAGKLKVEVDALTGIHYFISNADILRALGSFGYPLTKDERNHLLKIDVLEDRPHLLSPPIALGQSISTPLLTYLSQLSGLDGYAFRK